jgi:hypothetical protein
MYTPGDIDKVWSEMPHTFDTVIKVLQTLRKASVSAKDLETLRSLAPSWAGSTRKTKWSVHLWRPRETSPRSSWLMSDDFEGKKERKQ